MFPDHGNDYGNLLLVAFLSLIETLNSKAIAFLLMESLFNEVEVPGTWHVRATLSLLDK